MLPAPHKSGSEAIGKSGVRRKHLGTTCRAKWTALRGHGNVTVREKNLLESYTHLKKRKDLFRMALGVGIPLQQINCNKT